TISASGIASLIEKDHIAIRLNDPPRRPFTRDSERLARHDRVELVGPHIEFLDLVPVLRLVYGTADIAKPRRRVELEIVRLIVLPSGIGLLSRSASASAARHVIPNPIGVAPIPGEVGMSAHFRSRYGLVDRRFRLCEYAVGNLPGNLDHRL